MLPDRRHAFSESLSQSHHAWRVAHCELEQLVFTAQQQSRATDCQLDAAVCGALCWGSRSFGSFWSPLWSNGARCVVDIALCLFLVKQGKSAKAADCPAQGLGYCTELP